MIDHRFPPKANFNSKYHIYRQTHIILQLINVNIVNSWWLYLPHKNNITTPRPHISHYIPQN